MKEKKKAKRRAKLKVESEESVVRDLGGLVTMMNDKNQYGLDWLRIGRIW